MPSVGSGRTGGPAGGEPPVANGSGGRFIEAPWRLALADAEDPQDPGRRLSRGTLLAQAMHLTRRWEPFAVGRVLVVLPDGVAAVLVMLALKLAGKIPVLLPPALLEEPDLGAFLAEEKLGSVVSHTWLRAAHRQAPWPDHFLDLHAEMEELDDLRVLGDFAFAAMATPGLRRLRVEWRPAQNGLGWITRDPGSQLVLTQLTDRTLLSQVEMIRSTDLLHHGDMVVSNPLATAGGMALLWNCLSRGIPPVLAPEAADSRTGAAWLAEYEPTVAAGGPALAAALTVVERNLRAFVYWTAYGATLPEEVSSGLCAATGAAICQGLTNEAAGILVALSVPDPPLATRTAEPRTGTLAGSPGRLLPGLLPEALPPGWKLEESGYVKQIRPD